MLYIYRYIKMDGIGLLKACFGDDGVGDLG